MIKFPHVLDLLNTGKSIYNYLQRHLNRQLNDETTGLDTKAPVILETVSGAIASFADGADDMPIKKVVGTIVPVQDLHGYEYPWPDGGNVNKCPSISSTMTFAGVTLSPSEDGKCKLVGTATSSGGRTTLGTPVFELPAGTYYLSSNIGYDSTQSNPIQLIVTKHSDNSVISDRQQSAFTLAEATEIYIGINVKSGGVYNTEFYIQVKSGSAPTAYAPYSNICPISGWTGANVRRLGKNFMVFPYAENTLTRSGITYTVNDDGTVTVNGTATADSYFILEDAWPFERGIIYGKPTVFSGCPSGGSASTYYLYSVITGHIDTGNGASIGSMLPGYYRFQIRIKSGTVCNNLIFKPMFKLGSTASTYEPYTGTTIPITWETEAGTVYSGSDEVIGGTLKSTMGMIDLGTLSWSYSSGRMIARISDIKPPANNFTKANAICSMYPVTTSANTEDPNYDKYLGVSRYGDVCVRDSSYTDAATFKAAMSGVQLCYELATPVEYTIDGEELTTLYGTNNIWADTGDVEVTYPADTKLYVDNAITQAIANALNS